MYRRALLVALVVCCTGILFAAVHPASAGTFSETPTPDGAGDDGDEDDWYSGWDSDDDHRSEYDSEDDGEDSDDGSGWGDDDSDDGSGWGDDDTDEDTTNASEGTETDGDGNTSRDGEHQPAEGDDEEDGTDRHNETYREDGTDDGRNATEDRDGDDGGNHTGSLADRVFDLSNETVGSVTDGEGGDLDGDGDRDVVLVDVDDGSVRVGALTGESSGGADLVGVGLDDEFLDNQGRLRAGNVTVGGLLVVPLAPPEILAADGTDERPDDRPALDAPPASDETAASTSTDGPGTVAAPGSGESGPDAAEAEDESGTATDGGDDDGAGGAPGSGAGAGAALVVTVGLLGGTRTTLDQTAFLASQGPGTTLTTLRHAVARHLEKLPGGVLAALFGYSRHDGSDPLENDTRAEIYDIVRESPGTYHAQLAEETGVTVETVRYHSRILAEEGLVEARKIRGRRRLFPVTMDDDDPELAAAIADSAASDVLSVVERREPTTLSAIAEAVDCAPSTVSYHVDRLEDDGLVTRERDGGAVRVRLRRATRSALQGRVADD